MFIFAQEYFLGQKQVSINDKPMQCLPSLTLSEYLKKFGKQAEAGAQIRREETKS
jgi:hypothetical protein